jgi:hypothetical protein
MACLALALDSDDVDTELGGLVPPVVRCGALAVERVSCASGYVQ